MDTHPTYRIVAFEIVRPYTLHITFDDGTQKEIDFRPILAGKLFGPLQEESLFAQVALDPETHTLVWANGADFDPETLYNWERYLPTLIQMAVQWNAHDSLIP